MYGRFEFVILPLLTSVFVLTPLDLDSTQSFIAGEFQQSIHMPGTLIGDWDEATYPEGTLTLPGYWGGSGNQLIVCSIEPTFGGPYSDALGGVIDVEIDAVNEVMLVNQFSLHAFEKSVKPFSLSVIFEYETFRSLAPDSLFIGGFPVEIPFGEGQITAIDIDIAMPTEVALFQVAESHWSFSAQLPVIFTFELLLLDTGTGPISAPGILFLDGSVAVDGNSTQMIASSNWKSQETIPNPPFFFDNIPLELPTILPAGDFAGVFLSAAADEAVSNVIASINIHASGGSNANPNDVNDDGVVNVSDLLAIISAWGSCDGCPADVNSDGLVNVSDILAVIGDWG